MSIAIADTWPNKKASWKKQLQSNRKYLWRKNDIVCISVVNRIGSNTGSPFSYPHTHQGVFQLGRDQHFKHFQRRDDRAIKLLRRKTTKLWTIVLGTVRRWWLDDNLQSCTEGYLPGIIIRALTSSDNLFYCSTMSGFSVHTISARIKPLVHPIDVDEKKGIRYISRSIPPL